jgi:hypothetical protein
MPGRCVRNDMEFPFRKNGPGVGSPAARSTRAFRSFPAVARATALEALQQPVTVLLAAACFALCALQPLVQLHTFGEPGRMARDAGLGVLLAGGLLAAAFSAGATLSAEIRDGTAAAALAAPVSRAGFLLGKFAGVAAAVAVFSWCVGWAIPLAVRASEAPVETETFAGTVRDVRCGVLALLLPAFAFAAAAAADWRRRRFGLWFFGALALLGPLAAVPLGFLARNGAWLGFSGWNPGLDPRLAAPVLLVFLLLCVLSAWTTAFATRLPTGPSLALAFLVLLLGFFADAGARASTAGFLFFSLVPDVQAFWVADALRGGAAVPAGTVLRAALYAAVQCAFALSLGVLSFSRKDL